jgi:hypothetical protein
MKKKRRILMILSETKDLETLKKMQTVAELHIKRCLNPEDDDYNPRKAAEIQVDLVAVKLRIEELTN